MESSVGEGHLSGNRGNRSTALRVSYHMERETIAEVKKCG